MIVSPEGLRGNQVEGEGGAGWGWGSRRASEALNPRISRTVRPIKRERGEDERILLRRVAPAADGSKGDRSAARGGDEIPGDGRGRDALRR